MIINFVLCFVCGFLTKLTDNLIDEPFKTIHPKLKLITGLAYGLLAGYLIAQGTELATLVIAITIGVLIAYKIDDAAHQLAFVSIFAVLAFLGLPRVDFAIMLALIFFGWLDEFVTDAIDKRERKGLHINNALKEFLLLRPVLEIGAFAISALLNNWIYWIALFMFDLAYNFVDRVMPYFLEKFRAEYGSQVVVDLYKCPGKNLNSVAFVRKMLDEIPLLINMHKITKPVAFHYNAGKKDDSGVSGFVIIAESHISIHTYPKLQLVKCDIVSCREFDEGEAVKYLKEKFNAQEVEKRTIYRGKHYGRNLKAAKKEVEKERVLLLEKY